MRYYRFRKRNAIISLDHFVDFFHEFHGLRVSLEPERNLAYAPAVFHEAAGPRHKTNALLETYCAQGGVFPHSSGKLIHSVTLIPFGE